MRPGLLRRALVVVGCGALAVTASACRSTESESAKIAREGSTTAAASTLKLGAANREVRASNVTLMSGGGRKAVAVELTSTSSSPQREVPLRVNVTGSAGKLVYSNATGAEVLLSHVTLLRPHASVWWVDDEVLATAKVAAANVSVGTGQRSRPDARAAALSAKATHVATQAGMTTVTGVVANHTGKAQSSVPVFAVAVRGGKVVAAGRAVVASVPAGAALATPFDVPLVGDASGAKIELTALPGALAAAGGGLK
jgi:hypothetical protein